MKAAATLTGVILLLVGLLALFVASAWGPGNSDELVSGGAAVVPWFLLPAIGTCAAVTVLVRAIIGGTVGAALLVAAGSLAAWVAMVFIVSD